ncbi:MAG: hypothetical protein R3286_00515 [Gammaproteobacteria bacterium]|nr:hypothetical protein [Gammaproteobacteria bacterium]
MLPSTHAESWLKRSVVFGEMNPEMSCWRLCTAASVPEPNASSTDQVVPPSFEISSVIGFSAS